MSDLAAYLGLYVKGNAAQKVDELEKGFARLGTRGEKYMGTLNRSMSLAGQGLDKLANRYTALVSGAAGVGAVKMVADLDTRMTYLGITAGKSTERMDELKKKIFETAQAPDIRVDPGAILDAIDVIIEKTGNLDLAEDNIRNIGIAMRATQAAGKDIGGVISQQYEKYNVTSAEEMLRVLDHTVNAAKAGSVSVAELATKGPQLASAYATTGRVGRQAGAEMDAMVQMMIKGSGNIDQATTAFEAFMRTLSDGSKRKALTAKGIQIMDPDDPKRMRAGTDIIKDIITKARGDMVKISSIFDSEAMRGLNPIIKEFNDTGGFKSMDDFLNVASDGKTILADASTAAKTFGAATQNLTTAWRGFADANLTEPVRDLADHLNSLKPEKVQATFKALAWGVGIVGGLIAVKKGIDGVRWASESLSYVRGRKGGVAGAAAGAAGAAAGGPMPVIVMNWPGGGLGGAAGGLPMDVAGDGKDAAAKKGKPGIRGALGRLAAKGGRLLSTVGSKAGVAAALVTGGIDAGAALMEGDNRRAVGAGGRTAGALAGAAGGGAIGTAVFPGVGTAIGGLIGGVAGAWAGEEGLRKLYDLFSKKESEAAKVEGSMEIAVRASPGFEAQITRVSASGGLDIDVGHTLLGP